MTAYIVLWGEEGAFVRPRGVAGRPSKLAVVINITSKWGRHSKRANQSGLSPRLHRAGVSEQKAFFPPRVWKCRRVHIFKKNI